MNTSEQWHKPRNISVVVDNGSWILPFATHLVDILNEKGDRAKLCRAHQEIGNGAAAFYLGCIKIAPPDILQRNHRNLVVHESALPQGKGFAPMAWQILEGQHKIPVCLLEAVDGVDSGPVIYRDKIILSGDELHDEWRRLQGEKTVELCLRFLNENTPPKGDPQTGAETFYTRRRPEDSRIDPAKTIAEQFDLLRIVSNKDYPAFFEYRGQRYILKIEKDEK